jgi:vacuolar-type H+-ATPase subunit H
MREVIQGLVEAEREARGISQSAREEAERIVAEAKRHAHELIARNHEAARADMACSIEKAVQAAQLEKREALENVATKIQRDVRMDEVTQERLVEAVVQCICCKL